MTLVVITILASISTNHIAIIIIPSRTSSEQTSIQFKSLVQSWSPPGLEPAVLITLVLEFGDTILLLEETQRRRLVHLPLFVICRHHYYRLGAHVDGCVDIDADIDVDAVVHIDERV